MGQEKSEERTSDQDRDTKESLYVYMETTGEYTMNSLCTETAGRLLVAARQYACVEVVLHWSGKMSKERLDQFHTSLVGTVIHFVKMAREVSPAAFPGFRLQNFCPTRPRPQETDYLSYIRVTQEQESVPEVDQKTGDAVSPTEVVKNLGELVEIYEKECLLKLLDSCNQDLNEAAQKSGLTRRSFRCMLQRHGISLVAQQRK